MMITTIMISISVNPRSLDLTFIPISSPIPHPSFSPQE
jgi:hypothetical protein